MEGEGKREEGPVVATTYPPWQSSTIQHGYGAVSQSASVSSSSHWNIRHRSRLWGHWGIGALAFISPKASRPKMSTTDHHHQRVLRRREPSFGLHTRAHATNTQSLPDQSSGPFCSTPSGPLPTGVFGEERPLRLVHFEWSKCYGQRSQAPIMCGLLISGHGKPPARGTRDYGISQQAVDRVRRHDRIGTGFACGTNPCIRRKSGASRPEGFLGKALRTQMAVTICYGRCKR